MRARKPSILCCWTWVWQITNVHRKTMRRVYTPVSCLTSILLSTIIYSENINLNKHWLNIHFTWGNFVALVFHICDVWNRSAVIRVLCCGLRAGHVEGAFDRERRGMPYSPCCIKRPEERQCRRQLWHTTLRKQQRILSDFLSGLQLILQDSFDKNLYISDEKLRKLRQLTFFRKELPLHF